MNWLDIVIILLLLLAVWEGWRQGLITQILGLVAIVLGIWLAWRFGHSIGSALGMQDRTATVVGFIIVLVVVILLSALIGQITRGLFHVVGLGVFDNILGVALSALKMFVFMGLAMIVFEVCDPGETVITSKVKQGSVMYGTVNKVNAVVFPFIRDLFGL